VSLKDRMKSLLGGSSQGHGHGHDQDHSHDEPHDDGHVVDNATVPQEPLGSTEPASGGSKDPQAGT
jgi:hypothetical protein